MYKFYLLNNKVIECSINLKPSIDAYAYLIDEDDIDLSYEFLNIFKEQSAIDLIHNETMAIPESGNNLKLIDQTLNSEKFITKANLFFNKYNFILNAHKTHFLFDIFSENNYFQSMIIYFYINESNINFEKIKKHLIKIHNLNQYFDFKIAFNYVSDNFVIQNEFSHKLDSFSFETLNYLKKIPNSRHHIDINHEYANIKEWLVINKEDL